MEIYNYLDDRLIAYINNHSLKNNITEIRLRAQCPVQLVINGKTENVTDKVMSHSEIENILHDMCHKSMNVYEDEISRGFITLENGERIGIGGEFTYSKNAGKYVIKKLYSLNIRIPKNAVYFENQNELLCKRPKSTLIAGPPHSGKTSMLKLLCKELCREYRIAVCDERKELYTETLNCDVIRGIPKTIAVSMATRTLNPQFILCDEIGSAEEAAAILTSVNSGVEFICSVHGSDVKSVCRKPGIKELIDNNVFSRIAVMQQKEDKFCIKEICDV